MANLGKEKSTGQIKLAECCYYVSDPSVSRATGNTYDHLDNKSCRTDRCAAVSGELYAFSGPSVVSYRGFGDTGGQYAM
jgi:hypothetical protein